MRWSPLRIQLIPNYSYILGPNCWFSMDFGDRSSAPRLHPTLPTPNLLSIRSPGLISSLARLSRRGSQLLYSFLLLFPYWAPDALPSAVFPASPGFLSDSSFLSYHRLVIEKLVKANSVEDGVCCSLLLWNEGMEMNRESVLVIQSWLTLCNSITCSLPGSSVHGIIQARILEWVAISFSRESPNPGIEPGSPALQADCLPSEPQGS